MEGCPLRQLLKGSLGGLPYFPVFIYPLTSVICFLCSVLCIILTHET